LEVCLIFLVEDGE